MNFQTLILNLKKSKKYVVITKTTLSEVSSAYRLLLIGKISVMALRLTK